MPAPLPFVPTGHGPPALELESLQRPDTYVPADVGYDQRGLPEPPARHAASHSVDLQSRIGSPALSRTAAHGPCMIGGNREVQMSEGIPTGPGYTRSTGIVRALTSSPRKR